ncbi:MAG: hypothetical protein ACKVOQ_04220 [Cyclobacteriaceae bacterium]
MLYNKRIFLTLITIFALALASFGQVSKSPFSTFGIGDLYGTSLAQNQGMGGLGLSNPSSWYINNQNPALLVFNYVTSVQAGLLVEKRTINDGSNALKNTSGNLNYIAMAFPVKPGKWTTSIGLMPYSSVNYKLSSVQSVSGNTSSSVLSQETGSGGINQFYWSNGVRLHKNISVGMKASYLFSSIIKEDINVLNKGDNRVVTFYPSIYERNYVKDFALSGGFSFHKDSLFKKNYRLSVGVVYDVKSTLNTRNTLRIERRSITGVIIDSTTTINNVPSTIVLPQSYGAGISFGRVNHWVAGADVTFLDYAQFRGFNGNTPPTTMGIHSAVGLEVIPDPTSIGSYLKRMTYRTGVSYDRYPYLVNGNEVKDFGVNFGVSLPVGQLSTIDLALKVGKRGNLAENTIDENYFKLYFGMTFNDRWFIKRKFD